MSIITTKSMIVGTPINLVQGLSRPNLAVTVRRREKPFVARCR